MAAEQSGRAGVQDPGETAADAEPSFTLFARDPVAPFLVSILSSVRYGDAQAAYVKFEAMLEKAGTRYAIAPEIEEGGRALERAMAMFAWARRQQNEASHGDA